MCSLSIITVSVDVTSLQCWPYSVADDDATMTRGKPIQRGVRVKLPEGTSWQQLASMTPDEIKQQTSGKVLPVSGDLQHHPYKRLMGVLQMLVNVTTRHGFEPEGALTARVIVPTAEIPDWQATDQFFRQLKERLEGLPGVTAVGFSSSRS